MNPQPAVTAAVVTYNSGGVVADCLRSLPAGFGGIDYEVVVADNASSDDTERIVRDTTPGAVLVATGANRGYAAAVNAAIEASSATEAVFVLNPDVRLRPGSVGPLLDALREPGTGIAAPKTLLGDGSLALSLRREPTVLRAVGALLVGIRAGRSPLFGEVVSAPATYEVPGTFDWASGAALLVSKACLAAVGPWDESFFLYSEETDFALRARDARFSLRYQPKSVIVHLGGEMANDPKLWSMAIVNRIRLYRRRHGPLRSASYATTVALQEASRAARGSRTHLAGLRAVLFASARPAELGPEDRSRRHRRAGRSSTAQRAVGP